MAKKWLKIVYTEKNPAKLKLHYKSWIGDTLIQND